MNPRTLVLLNVSADAYEELAHALRCAGWTQAFIEMADVGTVLDMHGIGITTDRERS